MLSYNDHVDQTEMGRTDSTDETRQMRQRAHETGGTNDRVEERWIEASGWMTEDKRNEAVQTRPYGEDRIETKRDRSRDNTKAR